MDQRVLPVDPELVAVLALSKDRLVVEGARGVDVAGGHAPQEEAALLRAGRGRACRRGDGGVVAVGLAVLEVRRIEIESVVHAETRYARLVVLAACNATLVLRAELIRVTKYVIIPSDVICYNRCAIG